MEHGCRARPRVRGAWTAALAALTALATAATPAAAQRNAPELAVVVDLSKRQLDVRMDGEVVGTYEVVVGKAGHRTPAGVYDMFEITWNPSWVPPESEWADGAEKVEPSEPDNPMGQVKIQFADLLYVHGTNDTEALGEPASHGCIRMRNEDALHLARLIMEHGGAARSEDWYDAAGRNDGDAHRVDIPRPPTLRVTG